MNLTMMTKEEGAYHRVEQFLGELEADMNWTERVIDVRNWLNSGLTSFTRMEMDLDKVTVVLRKSGGEKNRLASTILATAIAYQYGIDVGGKQTETFRLVAVDEMSVRRMMNSLSIFSIYLRSFICSCLLFSHWMLRFMCAKVC